MITPGHPTSPEPACKGRPRPFRHTLRIVATLAALAPSIPSTALAQSAVEVFADGAVRLFELRTIDGAERIPARKVTQLLGLRVIHAPDATINDPDHTRSDDALTVEALARLRLDTDLGIEDTLALRLDDPSGQFIAADLQIACLRLKNIAGALDLSLGRDLIANPAASLALDGLQIDLRSRSGLSLLAYAGAPTLPQRRLTVEPAFGAPWTDAQAPAFDDSPLALGAALALRQRRLSASIALHRALSLSDDPRLDTPDDLQPHNLTSHPLIEDRLGAALHARPFDPVEISASAALDLTLNQLQRAHAELLAHTPLDLTLGLRAERSSPTFPLGSVFIAFGAQPAEALTATAAADIEPGAGHLALDASLGVRARGGDLDALSTLTGDGAVRDLDASLRALWRLDAPQRYWLAGFEAYAFARANPGDAESLLLAEIGGRLQITRKTSWVRARLLTVSAERDEQPLMSGASAAAQIAFGAIITRQGRLEASAEYASTPAFLHALSAFFTYSLDATLLE